MRINRRTAIFLALLMTLPLAAAIVPRTSPDFTANLPGNGYVSLSQYKGKVIALAFISPT